MARSILISNDDARVRRLRDKARQAGAWAYLLNENLLELPGILTGALAPGGNGEVNSGSAARPV